jgi:hypothetical protein
MGYIKEPEGVDFVVVPQTKPDPEADKITSEFLAKYRSKNKKSRFSSSFLSWLFSNS